MGNLPIIEFVERKEKAIRTYQAWHRIIHNEWQDQSQLESRGKTAKNDHTNRIFGELINFSTDVVNKGHQRCFDNYNASQFNLESIFMAYVTESILKELPNRPCDYVLRAHFAKQIDSARQYLESLPQRPED